MDERMRRWRESIARGMEEKRIESVARAAARTPGENIEAAFAMTAWASTFAGSMDRDEEVSPASIWRHGGR
jgi:hypothetical protein